MLIHSVSPKTQPFLIFFLPDLRFQFFRYFFILLLISDFIKKKKINDFFPNYSPKFWDIKI